jgi:arginyl-tRNA--protein-N-Asp/Glu arginylyltransferase
MPNIQHTILSQLTPYVDEITQDHGQDQLFIIYSAFTSYLRKKTGMNLFIFHFIYFHSVDPYRLQNPFGYRNSQICLSRLEVKSIQKCTIILVTRSITIFEVINIT